MNRKYGIGAVTTGSNNWQPRTASTWQRERTRGEILPMSYERQGVGAWLRGLTGRGR